MISKPVSTFQKSTDGLKSNYAALLDQKDEKHNEICDVTIQVQYEEKSETFKSLRGILALHSPVFYEKLFSNGDETLQLTDVTPECFRFLLQYFYGLNPEITESLLPNLMYASNAYRIEPLQHACASFIQQFIGSDLDKLLIMFGGLFQQSLRAIIDDLVDEFQLLSAEKITAVMLSPQFKQIPQYLVFRILQSDYIDAKEEIIWEQCVGWCKFQQTLNVTQSTPSGETVGKSDAASSLMGDYDKFEKLQFETGDYRSLLRELVPFIRFSLMDSQYFALNLHASDLDILTAEERSGILVSFISKEYDSTLFCKDARSQKPPVPPPEPEPEPEAAAEEVKEEAAAPGNEAGAAPAVAPEEAKQEEAAAPAAAEEQAPAEAPPAEAEVPPAEAPPAEAPPAEAPPADAPQTAV